MGFSICLSTTLTILRFSNEMLHAGIAAIASISLAAGTIGGVGLLGAFLLFRFIPRFVDRGNRPFP
ncbi:hypothetical protein ABMA10_14115 [Plantibacter sp. RU18]